MKKKSKHSKKNLNSSSAESNKLSLKKKILLLNKFKLFDEKASTYSRSKEFTTIIKKILIICTKNLRKKDTTDIKSDQISSVFLSFLVEFTQEKKLVLKLKM